MLKCQFDHKGNNGKNCLGKATHTLWFTTIDGERRAIHLCKKAIPLAKACQMEIQRRNADIDLKPVDKSVEGHAEPI